MTTHTTRKDLPNEICRTTIERIAREHLEIESLQPQGRDQIDFHDLAVWTIEAALIAAYNAGHEAAKKESTP